MGRMRDNGTWEDSCLAKLKPGEPFFVLRAQDALSTIVIEEWMRLAIMHGTPKEKIDEAGRTVKAMCAWPGRKIPD